MGFTWLPALDCPDAPTEGKDLESVQVLRQVWQQYYDLSEGKVRWRAGPSKENGEGVIVPRTTPKRKRAKSGKRPGWGTKSI